MELDQRKHFFRLKSCWLILPKHWPLNQVQNNRLVSLHNSKYNTYIPNSLCTRKTTLSTILKIPLIFTSNCSKYPLLMEQGSSFFFCSELFILKIFCSSQGIPETLCVASLFADKISCPFLKYQSLRCVDAIIIQSNWQRIWDRCSCPL